MFNSGSSRYKASRPLSHATADTVGMPLSTSQRQQVSQLLGHLGYEVGAMLVVVTTIDGRSISSWSRLNDIDADEIAMLSATSLIARLMLGNLLGFRSSNMGIVQEHDSHTIFLLQIAADMAIVVVSEGETRLGWLRIATQRVGEIIVNLLAAAERA